MGKKQNDVIDLTKLLSLFWDQKRIIIFSTLLCAGLGLIYSLLAPSVYMATASVQVEEKYTGGALQGISSIFEQESTAGTEIAVIKSRAIVSKAVEDLNLTTEVSPVYSIPFFSKAIEKLTGEESEITVARFVPKQEVSQEYTLIVGSNENEYVIVDEQEQTVLSGVVGEKYDNNNMEIQVTHLKGASGKRFSLKKLEKSDVLELVENLQQAVMANEKGKQTGVVELSLKGENPEYIQNVLESITQSYLEHSAARNSAEATSSLAFLEKRLPEVRDRLTKSENALNEYRQKRASIDLELEAKSVLDTLVQLDADLNALTIKESDISQRFTKRHPNYVALLEQRKVLLNEKARLTKQLESLPETQKDTVRLTRNFEVDQQIYTQLSNKIQELDVVKAGAAGNVRILDQAQTLPKPVAPRKLIILVLTAIIGFLLGSGAVLLKSILQKGVVTVSEISETGLVTYASVPFSKKQSALSRAKGGNKAGIGLLSERQTDDFSIESLRSLRTGLNHMLSEANNRIVLLSGVSKGVGRHFVSSNLANLLAKANKRVLLIDADLRRSHLHYVLSVENRMGVTELLTQDIPFEQGVQNISDHFGVITCGSPTDAPSELLSSARWQQLLDWAAQHYDAVIVTAPSILSVTDAAIVGQHADITLLIGRFEKTTVHEIEACRERFGNAGVTINGFILNGVKPRAVNRDDYFSSAYA
ncbi:polysaccharide biosynthesis protein GumC [Actinobacillus succinogenes]|uniref:Non-specific protein-tyrosine kinase n=1 Tax=Actinobacillus succinogenes (strain ATCC 55618 / DSM 22257 / CCUG 43843 / 130Z) TaxID=339671 RepID=A6VKH9_ACTSZ|nr:polysaccharide biosynthesis tyrosine autokinase [Actinobacillus succinogenes]ABR73476.1 Non-specific protein-tyrosine kinase [Actinobacillus succinogenes 130Z]PHI41224.1 polysaccharide biosynthesis protein GumC [Actinobacillus succinogenes]